MYGSATYCMYLDKSYSLFQGYVPFFVSATAGTTVYGAFDPLVAISDVCRKYKVWLHVDVSIFTFHLHNSMSVHHKLSSSVPLNLL